jgi:hypothetical protein
MTNNETLEPINPIGNTPYGAMIIKSDVFCSPTSLCTWSENKPAVYCQLPPHTLNPICQDVNKGIGMIGCYSDATCGGLIPISRSQRTLAENPHYMTMLKEKEAKVIEMENKKQTRVFFDRVGIILITVLVPIWAIMTIGGYYYHSHRKRLKKHVKLTRTPTLLKTRRISSGAGRIAKRASR